MAKQKLKMIVFYTRAFLPLHICALAMAMAGIRALASPQFNMPGTTLGSLVAETLGGHEWNMFINIDAVTDWLLALLPPLTGLIVYMRSVMGKTLMFSLYRHGSKAKWMTSLQASMLLYTLLLTVLMGLAITFSGFFTGMRGLHVFGLDQSGFYNRIWWPPLFSMFTYAMQSFMLLEIYLFFYLLSGEVSIGLIAFVLPVIFAMLRGSNDELSGSIEWFINWGMSKRYSFSSGEYGVPVKYGILRQVLVNLGLLGLTHTLIPYLPLTERKEP